MAEKPPAQSKSWTPFTAFPNALLDGVMPTLKDTEWRLLCVIVRQTLGWSDGGGKRKERDWLTQRQLMKRTGRHSAALSSALDALIRHRLVNAYDQTGNSLLSPQERRRYRGMIFYGLNLDEPDTPSAITKSELRKANTTKQTRDKRNNLDKVGARKLHESPVRIYRGWEKAGDVASARYNN